MSDQNEGSNRRGRKPISTGPAAARQSTHSGTRAKQRPVARTDKPVRIKTSGDGKPINGVRSAHGGARITDNLASSQPDRGGDRGGDRGFGPDGNRSASAGGENGREGGSAARTAAELVGEDILLEAPPDEVFPAVKQKRAYTKRATNSVKTRSDEAVEKLALLSLIGVSLNAGFGIVALMTKQPHWNLDEQESTTLATDVDSALSTLPPKYYGQIKKYIEQYFPWLALAITTSIVVAPKWKYSSELRAQSKQTKPAGNVVPIERTPSRDAESSEPGRRFHNGLDHSESGLTDSSEAFGGSD